MTKDYFKKTTKPILQRCLIVEGSKCHSFLIYALYMKIYNPCLTNPWNYIKCISIATTATGSLCGKYLGDWK